MNERRDDDATLREWSLQVVEALGIHGLDLDIDQVLGLAGKAAHAVLRPAAPLTTFLVGYAAGQASVAAGQEGAVGQEGAASAVSASQAVRAATDTALQLARRWEAEHPS
jgi:hypothetical protein